MALKQIYDEIRKIPLTSWKRIPHPREEVELCGESGSGSVEYRAKHEGLKVCIVNNFTWKAVSNAETDFSPGSSGHSYDNTYHLVLRRGLKAQKLTERGNYNELSELFEKYLETRVKSDIRDRDYAERCEKREAKEKEDARKKANAERSLMNLFFKK